MRFRNLSLVLCLTALAQSTSINESDSTAVALLLLANDMDSISVADVVSVEESHGRVTSLDLSNRGVYRLVPQIDLLDSLFLLDLSHNDLTHLDADLWKLPALRVLDVSYNELTTLPDSMVKLQLGYSFQDEEGLAHIVVGLSVDSNRLCEPGPKIEQWITYNTTIGGNPTWQNTQQCENGAKRASGPSRLGKFSRDRNQALQIWDLRGRAVPFGYAVGGGRNRAGQCVVLKNCARGKGQISVLSR